MHRHQKLNAQIAMYAAMVDFGKLEAAIAAHNSRQHITMIIRSREIDEYQLQAILGAMNVYGKVTTQTWDEMQPKGRNYEVISLDSLACIEQLHARGLTASGRYPSKPQIWLDELGHSPAGLGKTSFDIESYSLKSMADKLLSEAKIIEPRVAQETYPTRNRGSRSKGDRHKNKRFRWS